jgi:hypothetical protein
VIHKKRPASGNRGARIAWDRLQSRRPEVPLVALWYSRLGEPDYPSWMAEFADGEFEDEDGLVITWHKNNP